MAQSSSTGGVLLFGVLLVVFVVLKLTGNIDWSWWWVLSPIWGPIVLVLLAFSAAGIIAILLGGTVRLRSRGNSKDSAKPKK